MNITQMGKVTERLPNCSLGLS